MVAIDTPVATIDNPISRSMGPTLTRIKGFEMTLMGFAA
jgi:hypothetical protein